MISYMLSCCRLIKHVADQNGLVKQWNCEVFCVCENVKCQDKTLQRRLVVLAIKLALLLCKMDPFFLPTAELWS